MSTRSLFGSLASVAMALAIALTSARAAAECTPPMPSEIPDGTTASETEMIAAMKSFKQYDAAAMLYLKCLEEQTASAISKRPPTERGGLKAKQVEMHNAVIDALQDAANKFNKQVRVYKDRAKTAKN